MRKLLAVLTILLLGKSAYAGSNPPLTGLTMLVLGESHMSINNYLISNLPDELVQQGAKVYSYGACGASAGDWLKTKSVPCGATRIDTGTIRERPADIASTQPIDKLIEKHHPDLILLIMGDTMASYDNKEIPKSWVWQSVSSLTKAIKADGTRCVWVGPAWGEDGGKYKKTNARVKEFSDYLSTLVAPCTYIDSLTFSKIGEWKTFDGQHFDKWGYQHWAKSITNAIISPEILQTIKH
ncbi:MAG: SGNH/GDSL hydrolase family protein [Gallionella sp.]|jgi:hypothetical protein